MPRDTLNLTWQVAQASASAMWDLQLNCIRPFIHFRHSPLPPADAVVIAFTSTPAPTPSKNIRLSMDIMSPFAKLPEAGLERQASGSTFLTATPNFLLTDVFASSADGAAMPLYWKHILPLTAKQNSTVTVYDKNFQELDEIPCLHWRTDIENAFFNNLASSYNLETGEYQAYYISYLDASGVRQVQLLSNVPAFAKLLVEEYDELTPEKRYYSLDDRDTYYLVGSLFDFKLYSPTPRGLSYLIRKQSWGQLLPPSQTDAALPWIPRISNVDFYYMGRGGYLRRYYIAEFDYQNFSPYNPYKYNSRAEGAVVGKRLIKVPHGNLKIDPVEDFHLECIITKPDGDIRYALTTDSTKVLYTDPQGNLTGTRYRTDGFASYDFLGGFIALNLDIGLSDTVSLTYNYIEEGYDYPWINLNPRFNPDILEQEGVIYLVPSRTFTRLTNIYCNDDAAALTALEGVVEDAFDDDKLLASFTELEEEFWYTADVLLLDAAGDDLDEDLVQAALTAGKLILVNGSQYTALKSALSISASDTPLTDGNISLAYVTHRQGILVNASAGADALGATYAQLNATDLASLISLYKQLGNLTEEVVEADIVPDQSVFHLLLNQDGTIIESNHPTLPLVGKTWLQFINWFSLSIKNCNQFLVLGHLQVVTGGVQPYQIETVDCRQRGGGFKETDNLPKLLWEYPELNWCTDQGRYDGHPFPGAASILIELPYTMLDTYGGSFSHKQIATKIKKHLGAGVYPVIRYYGERDPRLISCFTDNDSIVLSWEDTGGPYTVYWGSSPESLTYSKVTNENTFTITGLNLGFTYAFLVTPIRDNSRMLSQEIFTVPLSTAYGGTYVRLLTYPELALYGGYGTVPYGASGRFTEQGTFIEIVE